MCMLFQVMAFAGSPLQLHFSSETNHFEDGEFFEVDVRVSDFDIVSMQYAIHWDEDIFEIESVTNLNTDINLYESNFGLPSQTTSGEPGLLRVTWFSSSTFEVNLPDNTLLFTMRLKAKGDPCAHSNFTVGGASDFWPVEVTINNFEEVGVCANHYIAQMNGAECSNGNTTLTCNDQINVSLDEDGAAILIADMFLEGGPYDYSGIDITPTKLSCADLGTVQYQVIDWVSDNTCWGTLIVEDKLGACGSGNASLTCNDKVTLSLDASGNATITPDAVLEGGPYDYSTISVTPSSFDCDDLGSVNYTAKDNVSDAECFGKILVEDILNVCESGNGNGNSSLACNDLVYVSVNPWGETEITADMVLEGGPYDYSTLSVSPDAINCDDIGSTTYTVTDSATGNTCWGNLIVEDKTAPVAIAKQNIVVSLTQDPNSGEIMAKLYAVDIDNGSFDNCTEVTLSPEFYEFDCSHIGDNQVDLIVTDEYGNSNQTWANVTVELKTAIGNIFCPEDIEVSCDVDLLDEEVIDNILGRATVDSECDANFSDALGYDSNGDGDYNDTFEYNGVTYSESYNASCSNGVVSRTWSLGESVSCTQLIVVNGNGQSITESDITWPEDADIDCVEGATFEPLWPQQSCSLVGYSVNSDTFLFEGDACRKILNTYTVIDWCSYDPAIANSGGIFTHTQILKYSDVESPVVTADDFVAQSCGSGSITASAQAGDGNCPGDILGWIVDLDIDSDWNIERSYSGTSDNNGVFTININEAIPASTNQHRLLWRATDQCGNVTSQTSYFTVEETQADTQKPIPYCINLSTALLSNGQVELYAKDFNIGSFDNCTSSENLRYTFTDVAPNSDPAYDAFNKSSKMVLTDADLGGASEAIIIVDMYVWDESNNSDFCKVNLRLIEGGTSSGGSVDFWFTNENASTGDEVCVPFKTNSFTEITGMQGSVAWDSSVLDYTETRNYDLPGMGNSNFAHFTPGQLSFVWFDVTGNTPATLNSGATVFEVCFEVIGGDGSFSKVEISNDPTAFEVSRDAEVLDFTQTRGSVTVGTAVGCVNDVVPPVAICTAQLVGITTNGELKLYAKDIDSGSYDNCTSGNNLRFTFSDVNPSNDPAFDANVNMSSKVFTAADLDANNEVGVPIFIWDESDNYNSCWSTLRIDLEQGCDLSEDDINWPLQVIEVAIDIPDQQSTSAFVSPDNLVNLYGFSFADVNPTFPVGCTNVYSTYEDLVIPVTDGLYKIIRTWTVLDWLTGEVYEYTQIIKNYLSDEYICDTLPRSAAVGDCASGHTLSDDVEWPNDITIADHRITPSELVSVSMIDTLDAQPSFYNEPNMYSATYLDLVGEFTAETIEIERNWTVSRSDVGGTTWNYVQIITVDLSEFGNLVTVNTLNKRPVPDVSVNATASTDMTGAAYTEETLDDPFKNDVSRNGLNIKDIILIQAQQLGFIQLSSLELQAADINNDNIVSSQDIASVRKVILGIDQQVSTAWDFVNQTSNTGSVVEGPKAHYVAIKPGDVDDTAKLGDEDPIVATERILIKNDLINAGEQYSVPLFFGRDIVSYGIELHLDFDDTLLKMKSVSATNTFGEVSWSLEDDNTIVILNYNGDGQAENISVDTPILTIEFEALGNGELAEMFEVSSEQNSWILDEEYTLLLIDDVYDFNFAINTEDLVQDLGVSVYPNPASQLVAFDRTNSIEKGDMTIELFDITGKKILQNTNEATISVSEMADGMYIYKVIIDDKVQVGRLVVKK